MRRLKSTRCRLPFLYAPVPGFHQAVDAPVWVIQAWEWILRQVIDRTADEPSWFDLPAMMRFAVTTPQVLKVLQARQSPLPYGDRMKPFNFVLSPLIDPMGGCPIDANAPHFTLIAPFTDDATRWYRLPFVNVHDGITYRLAPPNTRVPAEAQPQTYRDVVSRYRWHAEAKSLAPDGPPWL